MGCCQSDGWTGANKARCKDSWRVARDTSEKDMGCRLCLRDMRQGTYDIFSEGSIFAGRFGVKTIFLILKGTMLVCNKIESRNCMSLNDKSRDFKEMINL